MQQLLQCFLVDVQPQIQVAGSKGHTIPVLTNAVKISRQCTLVYNRPGGVLIMILLRIQLEKLGQG